MFGERRCRARMDVALQAALDRDAVVEDVRREAADLDHLAVVDRNVVDEVCSVPDAVGPAELQGLPDALRSEALTRVDRDRAVLNVEEQSGASFNAILIVGLDDDGLDLLDHRERGYTRTTVEHTRINPFLDSDLPRLVGDTYLYCGRPEKRNSTLLPNAKYLDHCMRGAKQWGHEFLEVFLLSTFVAEQTVCEFLAQSSNGCERGI